MLVNRAQTISPLSLRRKSFFALPSAVVCQPDLAFRQRSLHGAPVQADNPIYTWMSIAQGGKPQTGNARIAAGLLGIAKSPVSRATHAATRQAD
jgi:hypothetical protein